MPQSEPKNRHIETISGFQVCPGRFLNFGASVVAGGVNFTVHSSHASHVELLLFHRQGTEPFAVLPFPETFRIGNVYSMIVLGLNIEDFEYAYRVDGPYDPRRGLIFDGTKYLLDPYARAVTGRSVWGVRQDYATQCKARVVDNDDFDWGSSRQPLLSMKDLIIYEMHVRGFTKHPSSRVQYPGTFAGIMEKLPYLQDLGVNAIELMPVFEFDEFQTSREYNGKQLLDYWGYNSICFFAPNTAYSASVEYNHEGNELKSLIKALHENNMEIILDVVFNHTAEGDERGPSISLKGFDNNVYYMLTPDGHYFNFSGCGNTLNCNHPIVHQLILDCLRYWVTEYRVDGFRFDLASILGRNEDGSPMSKPPLLQSLAFDPILGRTKLIAEAWDAGGLYQVGSFPSWGRWSEWNGKYRDELRCFLKGDGGLGQAVVNRITGSRDLYDPKSRGENASVNFITCHDGFTLRDLYSYAYKHNEENGWNNTDGANDNNSWNCGCEGDTDNPEILRLRMKLMKNAVAVLLSSHGTPMLRAGDEFGTTQRGNNNAYCQDNEISWLNWDLLEEYDEIYQFTRHMTALRHAHPVLRNHARPALCGLPPVSLHGPHAWYLEPTPDMRTLGVLFAGRNPENTEDDLVFLALNMFWEPQSFMPPQPPPGFGWYVTVDTARADGIESDPVRMERCGNEIILEPRSVKILLGLPED